MSDVIDLKRTAHALVLRAGRHHEMLNVEMTAPLEHVRQAASSIGSIESIFLLDANPRLARALGRHKSTMPGEGSLLLKKCAPPRELVFAAYGFMLHFDRRFFMLSVFLLEGSRWVRLGFLGDRAIEKGGIGTSPVRIVLHLGCLREVAELSVE